MVEDEWTKRFISGSQDYLKACGVDNEYVVKNTTKEGLTFDSFQQASMQHVSVHISWFTRCDNLE